MSIKKNDVVTMHYTLTVEGEGQIDSSVGGDPLSYLHGHSNIVVGLEKELEGKGVGDKVSATVSPEEGYGVMDPSLDVQVSSDAFPEEMRKSLEPGMMFQGAHPHNPGIDTVYRVVQVEGRVVHVTANHPLAGQVLNFDVEVVAVREASTEELAHGHVHGPGGHHH